MGERLAWFFGITAPKYQYIIDEYHRIKEEVTINYYSLGRQLPCNKSFKIVVEFRS